MTDLEEAREHPTAASLASLAEQPRRSPNQGRPSPFQGISLRSLVSTRDAGVIIGRSGRNVQELRETTGVQVRLSEFVSTHTDRVVTVQGPDVDALADAYRWIVDKIAQEESAAAATTGGDGTTPPPPVRQAPAIRLLVPNSWMGALIGKGGVTIQHIQSASQCRLVASEAMLPHSTDREVTLFGTSDSVRAAVLEIARILDQQQQQQLQQQQQFEEEGIGRAPAQHLPYIPSLAHGGRGDLHRNSMAMGADRRSQPSSSARNLAASRPPMNPDNSVHPSAQVQSVYIPNEMVGAVIGRGGSKIKEIRQKSGASVRIEDVYTEDGLERLVTVTGTPANNKLAMWMLRRRLEQERHKLHQQKLQSSRQSLSLEGQGQGQGGGAATVVAGGEGVAELDPQQDA